MSLNNNECLKICEALVKRCLISDKNILSYSPVVIQDSNENINLNISTEKDDYQFLLKLVQDKENSECELNDNVKKIPKSYIVDEDIIIEVRDIAINGYTSVEPEVVTVLDMKYILKYLAYSHSKDLGKVFPQHDHSLNETGYKTVQNILFDLTEITNNENIDLSSFKQGVEKLSLASGQLLNADSDNVYVRSRIFNSKLFFKRRENQSIQCKMINMAPEKYLPLVYDVLLAMFSFFVNKSSQYHIHELLDYYYTTLEEILHDTDLHLSIILPREKYSKQIRIFTPLIKLEVVYQLCQERLLSVKTLDEPNLKTYLRNFLNKNTKYENAVSALILEIYECILHPNLSREDCYEIVKNKIGSGEYELLNWKLTPVDIRSGYLGDYFKVKINIKQNDICKTLNLFAKYLPTTNEILLEMAKASFNKEKFVYDTFIPQLKSLGLEAITDFLPDCYFARSNEVLIFEDISILNYSSFKPCEPLPYETMRLVIKQLAKLHACSFLYEEIISEKSGTTFRIDHKYEKYIQEIQFRRNSEYYDNKLITCGINAVFDHMLDKFPDVPKKLTMEAFKVKVKKAFDMLYQKIGKSNKYRNVLCQADLWGNNILFKMDECNKPISCYIVDYQLIRYCPPSHDLLFFLYVNTDKRTRSQYMAKLIEEYYTELSNILNNYNSDLNKIYTYEEFLDCCCYMKSAVICIALIYLPFTCYPPEKLQKINLDPEKANHVFTEDRKEIFDEMQYNEVYKQRIKEAIEDIYEVCENDFI